MRATADFAHNEPAFQQNHYILLNLALGGNWYGNPPASSIALGWGERKTMEVEWVRWYEAGTSSTIPLANPSFESGMTGWATWSPNGTEASDFSVGGQPRQLHPHGYRGAGAPVGQGRRSP